MRLLFSTLPAYGHVYPLMPLATAARDAGHDVHFATGGRFVPRLEALGFTTYDVGLELTEAVDRIGPLVPAGTMPKGDDGRPNYEVGGILFIDVLARHNAPRTAALLPELRPDLVVYEHMELGAPVAAHAVGIPTVCHALSPRLPDDVIKIVAHDRLERLWADYGGGPGTLDVFTGDVYVDIVPEVLQQPSFLSDPARMTMRPVPFAEPDATVPAWVGHHTRPLVYLTLGTVVATDEVLMPAVEGLATLDAEILVALGSAAGAARPELPANVHVEAFVNQAALMPHVDLAVHHGGTGTVLGALTHGTPQLLLPKGADQFFNADAMAAAGLADVIEPSDVTADAVATLAKVAMAERRPAVDAVRAELAAMPAPATVLDRLVARFG